MKTFDRYVVRSFLISVALCFLVLIALRILADLSANMDEFTESSAEGAGKTAWMITRHIAGYYGCQILVYWRELSGVIIVTAACFTLGWMNHTNELTAVLASGMSLRRVLLPVVLVAVGLNLLVVLDTEALIPRIKHRLVLSRDDFARAEVFQVRLIPDHNDSVWYSQRFTSGRDVLEWPLVILRDKDMALAGHVSGAQGRWDQQYHAWEILPDPVPGGAAATGVDGVPRLYLEGATEVYSATFVPSRFLPNADHVVTNLVSECAEEDMVIRARRFEPGTGNPRGPVLDGARFNLYRRHNRPTVSIIADRATYVPERQGWELAGGRLLCPTDLDPVALSLRRSSDAVQFMSTGELGDLLELPRVPDPENVRLTRQGRFADLFNNIIMLLVATPFILSRERNIKASALLAVLAVAVVYVAVYVCRHLDSVDPFLCAWAPILLFGPISAVTVDAVKT